MKIIQDQTFDMERALYGNRNIQVKNCRFDGPADGESAFKECGHVEVENCFFLCVQQSWTTLAGASPVTVIASELCS